VLLCALADGMEEALTVAENFLLVSAFVGCHVPDTARRLPELAELAHASPWMDSTLRDAPPALAIRIALSVALECAAPGLLLLDELPPLESDDFQRWACERTSALRSAGMAVVQLARDPLSLLGAPDRTIWLHDRVVRCCGHPRSVSEASSRIGFDPYTRPLRGVQAGPR
jgi:ABC-type polysaccharide/polyol phosphate transport system ATPase subunit